MATIMDARFAALRAQGFLGATSDMIIGWLQFYGAVSPSIPDAWREMLFAQTPTFDPDTYQRNDYWYTLLATLGYSGQLNDRELMFWLDGGIIGPQLNIQFSNSFGSAFN
jgi:hypothetical protein